MRIAVIGNSHTGMIRAASAENEFSDIDFTWMAQGGRGVDGLEVENGSIVARDPALRRGLSKLNMPHKIDLSQYDGVAFVGNTSSAHDLAYISRKFVVSEWLDANLVNRILSNRSGTWREMNFLTENALLTTLIAMISERLTYRLINHIHPHSQIPIYVVPQPYPGIDVLDPRTEKYKVFKKIGPLKYFEVLSTCLTIAHKTAFSSFRGVKIIFQNPVTIRDGFFTKSIYSRGSMRVDMARTHEKADVLHANAKFGKLVLQCIQEDLKL